MDDLLGIQGGGGNVVEVFNPQDVNDNASINSDIVPSEAESIQTNWRGWRDGSDRTPEDPNNINLKTLLDICCKTVAKRVHIEEVERRFMPVPETVLLKVAYWSFPRREADIKLYSILSTGSIEDFKCGKKLMEDGYVRNVMQVGFLLTGAVKNALNPNQEPYLVSAMFDRYKVTSCKCKCRNNASWCSHIIALCLYRIHKPTSLSYKLPVSESLGKLNREELQKFAQYLIASLSAEVIIPKAQKILDAFLDKKKRDEMNDIYGAPDPTAGTESAYGECLWYLDETELRAKVNRALVKFSSPTPVVFSDVQYMSNTEPPAVAEYSSLLRSLRAQEPEGMWNLLGIVRSMMKRKDSNGMNILSILTEECLNRDQIVLWWFNTKTSSTHMVNHVPSMGDSSQQRAAIAAAVAVNRSSNNGGSANSEISQFAAASMLDEIVQLWRIMVLNVRFDHHDRRCMLMKLCEFQSITLTIVRSSARLRDVQLQTFEGFRPAIRVCSFDWSTAPIVMCKHVLTKSCFDAINKKKLRMRSGNTEWKGNDDVMLAEAYPDLRASDRPDSWPTRSSANSKVTASADKKGSSSGGRKFVKEKPPTRRNLKLANLPSTYRQEIDLLFTRMEALHAHGMSEQASELGVNLAEETLANIEDFSYHADISQAHPQERREWMSQTTPRVLKTLERILLLCQVLVNRGDSVSLTFMVCLQGLELKRPPAATKAFEVKMFHLQTEIAKQMRLLKLGEPEKVKLSEKAMGLAQVDPSNHGRFVLPILLVDFMFDHFFVNANSQPEAILDEEFENEAKEAVLTATLNVMKFKMAVSEYEHPLLCEGTRRQKGELSLKMLELFKEDQVLLRRILDSMLDKSLTPNLRSSSAFPTNEGGDGNDAAADSSPPAAAAATAATDDNADANNAPGGSQLLNRQPEAPAFRPPTDSSDDERIRNNVYSPSRNSKTGRSPQVRPKRKTHCIANVNSSASEEAMLSDSSPRLRRRDLQLQQPGSSSAATSSGRLSVRGQQQASSSSSSGYNSNTAPQQRQQLLNSPSSDSGSSTDSAATANNNNVGPPALVSANPTSSSAGVGSSYHQSTSRQAITNSGGGGMLGPALISSSLLSRGYQGRKGNYRGRNSCLSVPDQPNQASEAGAYFYFELAKNVLVKAGGNSSTSLFNHARVQEGDQNSLIRNLVLAAFEIGLYSLGLSNFVTPNWVSRTYSSHVSWITGQATEIGGEAIEVLIDSWEGRLTASEISALADRSSHGRDPVTVKKAAELALTTLTFASSLNMNEIHRALDQCKAQGPGMLERACHAVEQAGKGGGVFPEVLFDVARMWEWIHKENMSKKQPTPPAASTKKQGATSKEKQSQKAPPQPQTPLPPPAPLPPPQQLPPPQALPPPPLPHPSQLPPPPALIYTIQSNLLPPALPFQPGGYPPGLYEQQMAAMHHAAGLPCPIPYAAVHIHPGVSGTTVNLLPLATVLPPPPPHLPHNRPPAHHPHLNHVVPAMQPNPGHLLPIQPPPPPPQPNQKPVSMQLQKAFKVSMLALELLAKKTEDRTNNKFSRNPPYSSNIKWLLKLSKQLGANYVQQFCSTVVGGVSSPFVLQEIATEAAKFFSERNQQPAQMNLRLSFVQPLVEKCVKMFVSSINTRLFQLHSTNDYDDFVQLVKVARNAFLMQSSIMGAPPQYNPADPSGARHVTFNEVLQTINRSKACKKELWQKLTSALNSA